MKTPLLLLGILASPLARADADDFFAIMGLLTPRVIIAPPVVVTPVPPVYAVPPPAYYPLPGAYYYGPGYGPIPYSGYPMVRHGHNHRDDDD